MYVKIDFFMAVVSTLFFGAVDDAEPHEDEAEKRDYRADYNTARAEYVNVESVGFR